MKLRKSEQLDKFGVLLFDKMGLTRNVEVMRDEIEKEISWSHSKIEEEYEGPNSVPRYGGVVYTDFKIVEDGVFCSLLDDDLTDDEKSLILRFVTDNELAISVMRSDFYDHTWKMRLLVPFVLNKEDSDKFSLNVKLQPYSYMRNHKVEAETWDGITEEQLLKVLTIYSLTI